MWGLGCSDFECWDWGWASGFGADVVYKRGWGSSGLQGLAFWPRCVKLTGLDFWVFEFPVFGWLFETSSVRKLLELQGVPRKNSEFMVVYSAIRLSASWLHHFGHGSFGLRLG